MWVEAIAFTWLTRSHIWGNTLTVFDDGNVDGRLAGHSYHRDGDGTVAFGVGDSEAGAMLEQCC